MSYYFPSLLRSTDFRGHPIPSLPFTVNSGANAIRLLLRSYSLKSGSRVALPVYVCDSLKQAVLAEGFTPVYLDLKNDGSFWADYHLLTAYTDAVSAVILVHLYGFIHPDTEAVMKFCESKSIFLLHDAAQSYGINTAAFTYSAGIVYSFGPGKSTTAAQGGLIEGIDPGSYPANLPEPAPISVQTLRSRLFLKSRIYGYNYTRWDKLTEKLLSLIPEPTSIQRMTAFQKKAAWTSMLASGDSKETRRANYTVLADAIAQNPLLELAFEARDGLHFKLVLKSKGGVNKLKAYLTNNQVAWFSLYPSLETGKEFFHLFPWFQLQAPQLLEISSEACLPAAEVTRVGEILKRFC